MRDHEGIQRDEAKLSTLILHSLNSRLETNVQFTLSLSFLSEKIPNIVTALVRSTPKQLKRHILTFYIGKILFHEH